MKKISLIDRHGGTVKGYAQISSQTLAAPNGYTAPSTSEDLAYIAYFRQTCKRYNIDFASADQDERDFVVRMAEKGFAQKRA